MTKAKKPAKTEPKKEEQGEEGVATSVLTGLGNMVPGLDTVIKSVGKSEAFRERLKDVEEEVEQCLREGWSGSGPSGLEIRSIPPRVRSIPPGRTGGKAGRRGRSRVKPPPGRAIHVDCFKEGNRVRVIAEVPGVVEKDIRVELQGDKLVLAADSMRGPQFGEFRLPRPCNRVIERHFRNGVLDLLLAGEPED
ncbi:MAG: Hsp20/alpha crystallin family protein [Sphingomonadales bacterium]